MNDFLKAHGLDTKQVERTLRRTADQARQDTANEVY